MDNTKTKVINYFKENFLQNYTKDQLDNLNYNLEKYEILSAAIDNYIHHKIITQEEFISITNGAIRVNYYAFSHFLLLIELIIKTLYKKSGRDAFIKFIKECINENYLQNYLRDASIVIYTGGDKKKGNKRKGDKRKGDEHIYCYKWTKDDITRISNSNRCNFNFDLFDHLEDNSIFPQFKDCIQHYKENNYDSFGSFLYELRCNYAHNAIPASLDAISVLIKNDKYIFYSFGKNISLLNLESNIFSILWKEKFKNSPEREKEIQKSQ